jgi:hypothetical protein
MSDTLYTSFRAWLLQQDCVTAVVGDRIRPDGPAADDGELPVCVVTVDEIAPWADMDGHGPEADVRMRISVRHTLMQVARDTIWALVYGSDAPPECPAIWEVTVFGGLVVQSVSVETLTHQRLVDGEGRETEHWVSTAALLVEICGTNTPGV